jgi:Na+/proline symporter
MTTWLPRGVLLAIGMVLVRLVQGTLINGSPTNAGTISFALCALFGVAAFIWALFDGMADARANPDPDRRRDLAMRWLMAGLVAGVLSGLVTWIISHFYTAVYVDGLGPELVVFPAFTALLIFLPAMIAVALGRWLVDRRRPPFHRQRGGAGGDVFGAVQADEDPNEKYAPSRTELDWRQEARESVRLEHEEADLRLHDRE